MMGISEKVFSFVTKMLHFVLSGNHYERENLLISASFIISTKKSKSKPLRFYKGFRL